jgi:hypothetical protein
MAFCTNCGASADGAFCSQCGRPLAQANGPAGSATNARPDAAAPPRRKTSPIVWILVAVVALACVAGAITLAGGLFLVHKARQAGVDADLFRDNPGLAIAKLIAAAHPDTDVVSTDPGSGTVTLRDRRTGKEMTLTFDQVRKGNFRFEADEDNGRKAVVQLGGDAEKIPAGVPVYPGAKVQATFEVDGNGANGQGAYEYEFSTPDAPSKVVAWYHRKLEEDGRKLALHNDSPDGGMLVAEDDANRRTLRVIVSRDSSGTTINLTARVKR